MNENLTTWKQLDFWPINFMRSVATVFLMLLGPLASLAFRRSLPLAPRPAVAAGPLLQRRASLITLALGGKSSMPSGITQAAREKGRARRERTKEAARAMSSIAAAYPAINPATGTVSAKKRVVKEDVLDNGPTRLSDLPDFRGPGRLLKQARKDVADVLPSNVKGNIKKKASKDAARKIQALAQGEQ